GQVVFIEDDQTLSLPDWRGNNRIDSLRNVVRDPRVSLMFLVPGSTTVIRVNGQGRISASPELLRRFAKSGKAPRSVLLISINEIYFQCARAVMRAGLWDGAAAPELPTADDILSSMTNGEVGGTEYDKNLARTG
ncbi:MAG: pyridoxamine 5'-phosphate oxidase family protein, partial [Paracoccaceae bacterium]